MILETIVSLLRETNERLARLERKADFELISEEHWQDVTADFVWSDKQTLCDERSGWTSITHRILCCQTLPDDYRLVKVRIDKAWMEGHGTDCNRHSVGARWAFRVEKKVEK